MDVEKLIEGVGGVRLEGSGAVAITGICEDSREVQKGFLFACLKGTRTDGVSFIRDALERGAAAMLVSDAALVDSASLGVPVVTSLDVRKAFAEISSRWFGNPADALCVVGVTGTNGKTTTTFLIKQLLEAQRIPTGWIGTVGYSLGEHFLPSSHTTPGAVRLQSLFSQMLAQRLRAVSMEVSSHALDQCRVEGIAFDIALFTNLTRDHLDYHGTFEDYLRCKMHLFELLNQSHKAQRCAIVSADDPACEKMRVVIKTPLLTFGMDRPADVFAARVQLSLDGTSFDLQTLKGNARVHTPLLGRFNVSNCLATAACGIALGLDVEWIAHALSQAKAPAGRMEFVGSEHPYRVVVDYAHTDDALRKALQTVREFTRGRVLLVFGCGGDRDRKKRPMMGRVAQELADFTFLTSDNPRSEDPRQILREIEAGFTRRNVYSVCEDRAQAIGEAIASAQSGDLVLIAGKGHESVQILKDRTIPFSDREVAQAVLLQRGAVLCKN